MIDTIDRELLRLLDLTAAKNSLINDAAKHILLAPGKRIRPLLTLLTAEMLGGSKEPALTAGCALEMMHTYSLIHDDLPCMDDDDLRRGLPTLHRLYDEATAILVGDFLLTYSFEVLSDHTRCSEVQRAALVTVLARAGGASGLVGGQLLDLDSKKRKVDVTLMHCYKTASLFKAALTMGAIVANAPKALIESLATLGQEIGLLFQLVDDIDDQDHPDGEEKAHLLANEKMQSIKLMLKALEYDTQAVEKLVHRIYTPYAKV